MIGECEGQQAILKKLNAEEFDAVVCHGRPYHPNGIVSHYEAGEKYCHDCERYYRTDARLCPNCNNSLRGLPRAANPELRLLRSRLIQVRIRKQMKLRFG
jgi:hypothetical protein